MEPLTPRVPEFAHYYGDWIWDVELTGWIKSLLLFFDGIALALDPEAADRLIESDRVLAQPLVELDLLRNYGPDRWLKPFQEAVKDFGATSRQIRDLVHNRQVYETLSEPDKQTLHAYLIEGPRRLRADEINAALKVAFHSDVPLRDEKGHVKARTDIDILALPPDMRALTEVISANFM